MRHVPVSLLSIFLLLSLTPADCEDNAEEVSLEVVVAVSPCSAPCGLGLKTQTLCLLKDGQMALEEGEEGVTNRDGSEVSDKCRVRTVKCVESWQCGLKTFTVTEGQRVEMDCVGEVMEAMGKFSWRVSWRYARGVITSDDSLFVQWKAPLLDRVLMDPVREEDAGTYRCEVQDWSHRRVKRVYWGVRVLPKDILRLDYDGSEDLWDYNGNETRTEEQHRTALLLTVTASVCVAAAGAGLILMTFFGPLRRRMQRHSNRPI